MADESIGSSGTPVPELGDSVPNRRRIEILGSCQLYNPPTFGGTEGPEEANRFIRRIEEICRWMECNDKERLVIAENHLKGEAVRWWGDIKEMVDEVYHGSLWMLFRMEFLNHYFPRAVREAKAREFESLEQGATNVEEYSRRFMELLEFASQLASTPEMRAMRYEQGLHPRIRERLATMTFKSLENLQYQARKIERVLEEEDKAERAKEAAKAPLDGFGSFFHSGIGCLPRAVERGTWESRMVYPPSCDICGRMHGGNSCPLPGIACYECGEAGHTRPNCPRGATSRMGNGSPRGPELGRASAPRGNGVEWTAPPGAEVVNLVTSEEVSTSVDITFDSEF